MEIHVLCTLKNGALRSLYGVTLTAEDLRAALLKVTADLRADGWDHVRGKYPATVPEHAPGVPFLEGVEQFRNEHGEPLDVEIYGID